MKKLLFAAKRFQGDKVEYACFNDFFLLLRTTFLIILSILFLD